LAAIEQTDRSGETASVLPRARLLFVQDPVPLLNAIASEEFLR